MRADLQSGQSIEDWLEHLATLNTMPTGQLAALICDDVGPIRFLGVKPAGRVVERIGKITGQRPADLRSATLQRFDGTGIVDLRGLDPDQWSTWRRVAARGWIHATGSAACPRCLATEGIWQLQWRLPSSTVCTRHGCYLVEQCPGCGRRFLDHPHTPLRPAPGTHCLNPLPGGGHCDVDVSALPTEPATDGCVARQRRHDRALNGDAPPVLGTSCTPAAYLLDVWALTVLMLHLVTMPAAAGLATWRNNVLSETARRRLASAADQQDPVEHTGPVRWSLHPPSSPATRSQAMAAADVILTSPNLEYAAAALHSWVAAAPGTTESRLGWLADRTRMTTTLRRLCMATLAPHQRISHALRASTLRIHLDRIPQAIPEPIYQKNAAHLFRTGGETPRHFLALCLARRHDSTLTWADAADILGVPRQHGANTARAISSRNTLDTRGLDRALRAIAADLYEDRCDLEGRVRGMAGDTNWFRQWSSTHRPGTRETSLPHAVTWLWCHVAGGLIRTSPGEPVPPGSSARIAYRQFEASLTPPAANALTALVDPPRPWRP
ncbi:TniQ family protein [Isoptericola sp. NPDC019571]|uniref:TniQ family protein n=1 Tax=Isoptericola sp. NPDC019571 TaxID=3364008 RepID=UPI0037BCF070